MNMSIVTYDLDYLDKNLNNLKNLYSGVNINFFLRSLIHHAPNDLKRTKEIYLQLEDILLKDEYNLIYTPSLELIIQIISLLEETESRYLVQTPLSYEQIAYALMYIDYTKLHINTQHLLASILYSLDTENTDKTYLLCKLVDSIQKENSLSKDLSLFKNYVFTYFNQKEEIFSEEAYIILKENIILFFEIFETNSLKNKDARMIKTLALNRFKEEILTSEPERVYSFLNFLILRIELKSRNNLFVINEFIKLINTQLEDSLESQKVRLFLSFSNRLKKLKNVNILDLFDPELIVIKLRLTDPDNIALFLKSV